MKVALVIISDRGELYLPQCLESLERNVDPGVFCESILVDDSEHKLGLAGAVRNGWSRVSEDVDFIMHVEEDFFFERHVDISLMARILDGGRHLAQVVLLRQPWSPMEMDVGGFIWQDPNAYGERCCYLEHRKIFSLNPCLIPRRVFLKTWPDTNEAGFTRQLTEAGYSFAILGGKNDPPAVTHVGAVRSTGWHE